LWSEFYADIYTARVFGCGGLSLGVSFIYIFLMRLPLIAKCALFGRRFCDHCFILCRGVLRVRLAMGWDDEEPQVQDSPDH
jgi:hypothetical protein